MDNWTLIVKTRDNGLMQAPISFPYNVEVAKELGCWKILRPQLAKYSYYKYIYFKL